MENAIEVFYYIFTKVYDLLFNSIQIAEGVTFGWVLITVIVFAVLFRAILNIPRISRSDHSGNGKD